MQKVPIFVVLLVAESFDHCLVKPLGAVIDVVGTGYIYSLSIIVTISILVDLFSG